MTVPASAPAGGPSAGRSAGPVPSGPTLVRTDADGVATLRINRPDALNALDTPTKVLFRDTLSEVARDPAVRCVVITGTGRAFCVGQDLREHVTLQRRADPSLWRTVPDHFNPIAMTLAGMPKPVIAAINGVTAGAGGSIAFAADLRIVAASARFTTAFAGIALSADTGTSWWLPRLVGPTRAMELLLTGRTLDAQEALDLGIATEVVPDEKFQERVTEVAVMLAAGPTLAFASIRRAVAFSATHDLPTSLDHEARLMELTGASQDHAAAVAAFLAKAPPQFQGR